jgi:hypothetical protein
MKGRKPLRTPCVDGSIILKYLLKKSGMGIWIGINWLRTGSHGGIM